MGLHAKTAGLLAFLVAAQHANAQTTVYLAPPPAGSTADVTGTVTGVPAGNYMAVLLVSQDQNQWWDKTHGAAAALSATGTFAFNGWAWDAIGDAQVPFFGVWIVPASYDLANFHCEGQQIPADLVAAAIATSTVNRANPQTPPAGGNPQVSPSAAPAGGATASRSPAVRASDAYSATVAAALGLGAVGVALLV